MPHAKEGIYGTIINAGWFWVKVFAIHNLCYRAAGSFAFVQCAQVSFVGWWILFVSHRSPTTNLSTCATNNSDSFGIIFLSFWFYKSTSFSQSNNNFLFVIVGRKVFGATRVYTRVTDIYMYTVCVTIWSFSVDFGAVTKVYVNGWVKIYLANVSRMFCITSLFVVVGVVAF